MEDVERDELRRGLMHGRVDLPRVGSVVRTGEVPRPYEVRALTGVEVAPVTGWVEGLVIADLSSKTVRAYCYALLTWFRVLWLVDVDWERATESETAAMVGCLRLAVNPQRRRGVGGAPAGSVNVVTGKPSLSAGYSPSTVSVTLAAVHNFYGFHARRGRGPLSNPVPASAQRRRMLSHRSPLEPMPAFRRGRYRQRGVSAVPRSIPDPQWTGLVGVIGCDRDRALLECFVSSGARATEMLGTTLADVDWSARRLWVVSKGTRVRRMVPLSPDAVSGLANYLSGDGEGGPAGRRPLWRTARRPSRQLTYAAARRVLQRAK